MKKRTTATLSAMALIAILATASSTSAQSNYGIRITVPFDFTIGEKSYPAGQYTVGVSSCQKTRLSASSYATSYTTAQRALAR